MARKRVVPLTIAGIEHVAIVLARKWMDWNEPIPDFHTRFPNQLESCLSTPFAYFNQKPLYPRLVDKASMLFYLLIKNHPFINGNKRIAVTSLLLFLRDNGKWLKVAPPLLYKIAVNVAKSKPDQRDLMIGALTAFITKHLVSAKEFDAKE